jgi:hypothetical protein
MGDFCDCPWCTARREYGDVGLRDLLIVGASLAWIAGAIAWNKFRCVMGGRR